MSREYDNYIKQHKENVMKGFEWIEENLPEILIFLDPVFIKNVIAKHDESKYDTEEYSAYDIYFYRNNRSYKVVQDFNRAWLHHIHNNPHHWQHWVLINDDPNEGEKYIEMPYEYIIEMICDWWAFSWDRDNLYEIFDWYNDHKDYIKLHNNTRKTVEDILDRIKQRLWEMEK